MQCFHFINHDESIDLKCKSNRTPSTWLSILFTDEIIKCYLVDYFIAIYFIIFISIILNRHFITKLMVYQWIKNISKKFYSYFKMFKLEGGLIIVYEL